MAYNSLGKFDGMRGGSRAPSLVKVVPPARGVGWLLRSFMGYTPLLLVGCLTDFPPLRRVAPTSSESSEPSESPSTRPPTSTGTAPRDAGPDGSTSGSSGSPPSSSDDGGTSGATSGGTCGEGYVDCGRGCVRGNSCCETNCEFPHAIGECRDGQCALFECEEQFYDCDGEPNNGCELGMPSLDGPEWSEEEPLPISKFTYSMGIDDINQGAWEGVPRYNLHRPCPTCERSEPPPGVPPVTPSTNRGSLPPTRDLRGSFALAWNELGLWVNVAVIDDQWVTGDDIGEEDPRLYDDVMLVWDDRAGESDAGSGSDRVLFAGIDGTLRDWRVSTNGAATRVLGAGSCRSVHLLLTPTYLFVGNGGAGPLGAGEIHGLNVAYNDFDWVLEDARVAERQHFVFGLPMTFSGSDYFAGPRVLPQIELVEAP